MTVFFIGWELWQKMSFVLACCIVLVFVTGLVKLWLTNRTMRRLEIIDEEKRARVSTLSHCGLDIWKPPEIPFGVRAIQNGIEVEGIWISRPNTPDMSQIASSTTLVGAATLIGDQTDIFKGKERMTDSGSGSGEQALDIPGPRRSQTLSSTSAATVLASEYSLQPEIQTAKANIYLGVPQYGSYDRRLRDTHQKSDVSSKSSSGEQSIICPGPETGSSQSNQPSEAVSKPNPISESTLSRSTEIIVNRNTRRANRGCVVFPAGSRPHCHHLSVSSLDGQGFGIQQRISDFGSSSTSESIQGQVRKSTVSKRGGMLSDSPITC